MRQLCRSHALDALDAEVVDATVVDSAAGTQGHYSAEGGRIMGGAGAVIVVPLSIARSHSIAVGASSAVVVYDESMDADAVAAAIREAMKRR